MGKKSFYILLAVVLTITLFSCNKTQKSQTIQKATIDKSDEIIGPEINLGLVTEMGDQVPFMADLLGRGALEAANLYFDKINKGGGVNGRVIKIIPRHISMREDFKLKGAVQNLLKEKNIFSFLWPYCLVQTAAVSETLKGTGIPVLFPMSGVNNLADNIFYIRPSFLDERDSYAQKKFRKDIFTEKTGTVTEKQDVCYYARSVFFSTKEFSKVNLASDNFYDSVSVVAPKWGDDESTQKTVAIIKNLKKEKVKILLLYASPPGTYFVKLLKDNNYNPIIHTYSLFYAEGLLEMLYPEVKNFYFSNPFPLPSESKELQIVQELEMLMHEKGLNKRMTSIMLEGYLGAKLFVQVLKNVGPDLTRRKFISELKLIRNQDFGGITIDFSKNSHRGNSKAYIYKYDVRKFKLITN